MAEQGRARSEGGEADGCQGKSEEGIIKETLVIWDGSCRRVDIYDCIPKSPSQNKGATLYIDWGYPKFTTLL